MIINNSNFLQEPVPKLNPFSLEYLNYWKREKRRIVEGYWSGGKFMPPLIYMYVNHWHIELNKNAFAKTKSIDKPFLRDLEWEKGYIHLEARGFSGFEEDLWHTCLNFLAKEPVIFRGIDGELLYGKELDKLKASNPSILDTLQKVEYVAPREYLRRIHRKDYGKPLYMNPARNVIDIESRGTGKSFLMSCMVAHNFLTDGATDYDQYLDTMASNKPMSSETLIGAIDSFYSRSLIKKVQLGLKYLQGGITFNGIYYPSPLSKAYTGSWESGKTVLAEYETKEGGEWKKKGTNSKIQHRSFKDNPFAANGTRPGFTVLEEIGFFSNLLHALGPLKECTYDSATKFGTIWMAGTGGDMEGGSTEAAKKVFYNPDSYDCLSFKDEWEDKGSIGMFIPAWRGLNDFKDKEGNTNKDAALEYLMTEREKAVNSGDRKTLDNELQNRPLKPSEAFLVLTGNIFPVADLKEHLSHIETDKKLLNLGDKGELLRSEDGKVFFKMNNNLQASDYPVDDDVKNIDGCVVIWEHPPEEGAPFGLYIGGIDPYDQDKAENSKSLGSCFIYKRFEVAGKTYQWPVAEYTGRPQTASEFYENCRRLLEYYGAQALYENQVKGLKQYFETKYCLHLLCPQPAILKEISPNSKVERGYGCHMTTQIKQFGEFKIRDWLLGEDEETGKRNLTKIMSVPLLKELIAYNIDGNFDRVIGFMMCIIQDLEMHKIVARETVKELQLDNFFNKKLYM